MKLVMKIQEKILKSKNKKSQIKNLKAPEITPIEFYDIIEKFSEKGEEQSKIAKLIIEGGDSEEEIMFRDTGRINKASFCRITGIKPKRLEELLNELKECFHQ